MKNHWLDQKKKTRWNNIEFDFSRKSEENKSVKKWKRIEFNYTMGSSYIFKEEENELSN